jgi:N6-L-threonylcarbamoyladenine synthase
MNILAIESSCDETAVSVVQDGRKVLADCIASQVDLHRIYGGVVPEIASRMHIEAIYGLADQALAKANITRDDIDYVVRSLSDIVANLRKTSPLKSKKKEKVDNV